VCFGYQTSEWYFSCLLKSNTIPASRQSGREGDPFVIASVPRHIRDQFPNQNAWALDRMVVRTGTVVPQKLWTPQTVTDRRQHVEEAPLQMPIFFQHTDGRLGLPLDVAISGRCYTLLNAQHSAPLGPPTTTYIRILVSDIFSAAVYFTFTPLQRLSGLVMSSSGARFKSVTKRLSGIMSLSRSLRST
jgi:hypothetical protein